MGNWNRRYMPRHKKSRHSEYEDTPLSPNINSYYSGAKDNRLPYWEIDYCKSVKVPWNKILASKKYIVCYPTVLNWDASAGEEALKNAKQRYLAMINGIPCDNPLPDPDMYIGEIDWNSYMDPELMAEIDKHHFDPDKAQEDEKLEMTNEEAQCSQAQKNQTNTINPWEGNHERYSGNLKEALHGWSRWDDSVNLEDGNLGEQSGYQQDFSGNLGEQRDHKNDWRDDDKNGSRGWRNNVNDSWGRRENGNDSWGCKVECHGDEPKYSHSKSFWHDARSRRGGYRNTDRSLQRTPKHMYTVRHGDAYRDSRQF